MKRIILKPLGLAFSAVALAAAPACEMPPIEVRPFYLSPKQTAK